MNQFPGKSTALVTVIETVLHILTGSSVVTTQGMLGNPRPSPHVISWPNPEAERSYSGANIGSDQEHTDTHPKGCSSCFWFFFFSLAVLICLRKCPLNAKEDRRRLFHFSHVMPPFPSSKLQCCCWHKAWSMFGLFQWLEPRCSSTVQRHH